MKQGLAYMLFLLLAISICIQACTRPFGPRLPVAPVPAAPTSTPTLAPIASPTFTPTGTPSATPVATLSGWDISGPVSITPGEYSYSYIALHAGAYLELGYPSGSVTFDVSDYFSMATGSTIIGSGMEVVPLTGAGTPADATSGAGAGHGGAGGSDALGNPGGTTYDNPLAPFLTGYAGGAGACSAESGGGLFRVNASSGSATLNGLILMNGTPGYACDSGGVLSSGGASGGSIYIQASSIVGSGNLDANGGAGAANSDSANNSGGGGGGIIVLSTHTANNFTGVASVLGGTAVSPAHGGQVGVFNQTTY